ncbi:MAG: hypothetical protein Q8O24_03590 [Gallionellaceae bacterium]|nr:hypothetical protein [Gallionellaceae bacterium]
MRTFLKQWWQILVVGSVLTSVTGVSLATFASDPLKANIALGAFLLFLIFLGWRAQRTFDQVLGKTYPRGYETLSTFVRYSTSDGNNIQYETFRHIQNKVLVRDHMEHQFLWTGSKPPKITSCLQTIGDSQPVVGTAKSKVRVNFKKPILFNEVEVVHLRMEIDDSDHTSETYVGLLVREPTKAITFKVELLHVKQKYNGAYAKVLRNDIDKNNGNPPLEIDSVKFDIVSKSFEYILANPTPGYRYSLEWERKA